MTNAISFDIVREKLEGIKRSLNAVTYNVLAEVIQRVDSKSPVGDTSYWKYPPPKWYQGGQFRGNWQLGVNSKPTDILYGNIDPSGVNTVGSNLALIPENPAYNKKFYLVNNLPYAQRIEDGWSPQAPPQGIIGALEIEFPQIVNDVVNDIKASGGRVK